MTTLDPFQWSDDQIDLAIALLADPPARRFNGCDGDLELEVGRGLEVDFLRSIAAIEEVSSRPAKRIRIRIPALVAAAAAAILIGAISTVAIPDRSTAFAATPSFLSISAPESQVSANQLLSAIAGNIDVLAAAPGSGRTAYLSTRSWSLYTEIRDDQTNSRITPQIEERWLDADGSGRVITASAQNQSIANEFGPNGLASMWPLGSLSSDDSELAQQLGSSHRRIDTVQGRFDAVRDAATAMPLSGALRASLLRFYAKTPTLIFEGTATDRIGRTGLAFSAESADSGLPTKYTVIIDESSGNFLDFESSLTTIAGGLNVRIPSVIGYDVIVESRYVGKVGD